MRHCNLHSSQSYMSTFRLQLEPNNDRWTLWEQTEVLGLACDPKPFVRHYHDHHANAAPLGPSPSAVQETVLDIGFFHGNRVSYLNAWILSAIDSVAVFALLH